MPASFTVAIPTHDRRETVVLAARSALAQGHPAERVIVLCDGCSDGTQAALAALGDPRLEVLDLPKGPGYAYDHRNRALERAGTEAIVYLGDDDLLLPDHLERVAAAWAPEVDVVTTPAAVVEPDDELAWAGADWRVPAVRDHMERENTNVMASVAIRVATARAVGGWDGALERRADWELWRRALRAGARPVATLAPTVLHFKATGRTQAWPDRVAQNTRWWATLGDPEGLAALRERLARLHGDHAAALWGDLVATRRHRDELQAAFDRASAHAERVSAHAADVAAHADRVSAHAEAVTADRDRLAAELAALRAERQPS